MSYMAAFRNAMHQEPIIVWSCIIGGIGLALPVVVPPIRSMLGFDIPEPVQPPPVRTLIENAKK